MPEDTLHGIPFAWITAGHNGVIALHKRSRAVAAAAWDSPSSEEVAAIIAAVRPLIEARLREEIATVVEGCGVPGAERMACEEAAAIVRKGQERSDEKDA